MGIISPPILDMMIESKFRIYNDPLNERLFSQIELFNNGKRGHGFSKAQIDDAIERYTKAIEKIRKG